MKRQLTRKEINEKKEKENNLEVLIRHMTKYKIIKTNLRCFCISIFVLALYFLIVSILLIVFSRDDYLYSVRFDDKCLNLQDCDFNWNLDKDLQPPIYLLFGFKNFFVNHRSVALSTYEPQLIGSKVGLLNDLREFCGQSSMYNSDLMKLGHAIEDPSDTKYVLINEVRSSMFIYFCL